MVLGAALPVYAEGEDDWFQISRRDLADLLAKSAELDATRVERDALKGTVVAQDAQIKAQAQLITLQDQIIARKDQIIDLADKAALLEQGRADRIEASACKSVRMARVTGFAATGATAGSLAVPGPGTLVGAAIGAAIGFFLPCP